ncbi:protein Hook homolog 3-like isoform X2 [Tubulanus polymorphus]|uniref:protein Hook homolog 3-like isoform X2 n=1 Tax=Tubulanus polymorphus TaxID=672921 RepID=UPI003DA27064
MDKDLLCESLIKWLQTFSVERKFQEIDELSDGIVMSQVLHQISSEFFDAAWLSKIKADARMNWRLKVSNLKKILKGILDYYAEVLGQQINDFHMPDINAIGEEGSRPELGRLLQLILGCAVNCNHKQEYIEKIMAMEETVQQSVMHAIQELMTKEAPANISENFSELGEQLKRTTEELQSVIQQRDEIATRCRELDLQVAALQDERATLSSEYEKLQERMNQSDSLDDPTTTTGRRYQTLQHQVEKLQDEVYRLEAARDDYRVKVELLEREVIELQQKNDDMTSLAEEARSLKDEIDFLKHNSDKVAKYELTIETYKKKMEEMGDLKRQLKILEEKNTSYMQQNMELEEDVRKSSTLKSQLEMYKRQVQELQGKSSEETKRADKLDFENKRLQEKISSLLKEKERLMIERDSLKETNEELTCSQLSGVDIQDPVESGRSPITPNFELMNIPPEVREKLIRLQHENQMLKLSKSTADEEDVQLVKSMLEDVQSRNSEIESENRIANQRIIELEAQIQDIQEQSCSTSIDHSQFKKQLKDQLQKNKQTEQELQKQHTYIEELESKESMSKDTEEELRSLLIKKDDEMKVMEERYKKYLEKAKSVIRTLDPKFNPSATPEVQALRNQLQEKDRLIEHLERDQDRIRSSREQEEKLLVSAFYNLGMQLHRKAGEERLAYIGAGQSFLARQRQAQNRRLISLPHSNVSPR